MKTILKIIPFVLVSVLLGCQKDNLNKDLNSTKWYLQAIQHTDTQIEDLVPENFNRMNVVFSDSNRLHAISSCNVFDGDFFTTGSDSIHIMVGTTKMYCTDFNRRLWDSLFYHNLNNSSKYSLIEGTLSIQTTKNTVMIFK
jgi:heat shock protein HslJ